MPMPSSRKHYLILSLLMGAAVVAAYALCSMGRELSNQAASGFAAELPPSARDIREQKVDMFPDWEYYLTARMPEQDCEAWLLKLAQKESLQLTTEHKWLNGKGDWAPALPPPWWQLSDAAAHYHGRQGDVNTCAQCAGGTFFYWMGSH